MNKSYYVYHAECWAENKTSEEIQQEIDRCELRYMKGYQWNEVGSGQGTIWRIEALQNILDKKENKACI